MVKGQIVTGPPVSKPQSRKCGKNTTPVQTKRLVTAASAIVPSCCGCGSLISDDIRALQCEMCASTSSWKCIECLNISIAVYDALITDGGCASLHWFCQPCEQQVFATGGAAATNTVVKLLEGLSEQVKVLDMKLKDKADVSDIKELQNQMEEMTKVEKKVDKVIENVSSVHESMDEMMKVEKEVMGNVSSMHDCVEGVIKVQLQVDKQEEAEKTKRKTNLIIHGIKESQAQNAECRIEEDADRLQELFHVMKSDHINVAQITRLGKSPAAPDAKPRPIRIQLETEEAKLAVLRGAKNLKGKKEGENVFLHPDLTPKERQARKLLVQELKERKAQGEDNLIIVNGKIVVRRATADQ